MKALVKERAGPGFTLKDVPEPRIRDDEVLIRVRRAGVCGTDVHIYEWDDWAKGRVKPPITVGHAGTSCTWPGNGRRNAYGTPARRGCRRPCRARRR